jgi:hypothetical protein
MPELTKKLYRRDLGQIQKSIDKLKNPKEELGLSKIKARPISSVNVPNNPSKIKRAPYIEPTVAQNKKAFEFEKRARKSAPTFNEITTKTKLGVNKGLQGVNKGVKDTIKAVKGVTKVKVANSLRSAFAPNTTVKRDYADPTRVNLGDGSKLGDKKTVQKLDKEDGTVLKTKTKQVVSKKSDGDYGSGYISINKSKRSKFADEGIEGFSNKKTKYRKTITQEGKSFLKTAIGSVVGFPLGVAGISTRAKNKARRANTRAGIKI